MNFKSILNKLKNPQITIFLALQIGMLLMQFGVNVNNEWLNNTMVIICSILVVLGIMNNPNTKGFHPLEEEK